MGFLGREGEEEKESRCMDFTSRLGSIGHAVWREGKEPHGRITNIWVT